MTEITNLESMQAYLASMILPQGCFLPAPMVVLPDNTPLYDEEGLIEEMDLALSESRAAKITGEIIGLENYNENLITVTFKGDVFKSKYRINVPRQLMQVGYTYSRLMKAPALALVTESEATLNASFDVVQPRHGEMLPPWASEDILVRLEFPAEMSQKRRETYSEVLNNLSDELVNVLSKEERREMLPKVRLVLEASESQAIRLEVIQLLTGLMAGDEDSLLNLFSLAEHFNAANASLMRGALLEGSERKAILMYEFLNLILSYYTSDDLIHNLEMPLPDFLQEEEEAVGEEGKDELGLELFGNDFAASLGEIVSQFRQENPETVEAITPDSTLQDRENYLELKSSEVPLMGGLMTLSDRLNVDYYYKTDWHPSFIKKEEYGTRGELLIALTMLTVQRIYMVGQVVGIPVKENQEMQDYALDTLIEILTNEKDEGVWFLMAACAEAVDGDMAPLLRYLELALSGPRDIQMDGPFTQLIHWMSHQMVEQGYTLAEAKTMFEGLPIMLEFAETLFMDADSFEEDQDDDEFDEEQDLEDLLNGTEDCYSTNAITDLPYYEEGANTALAGEGCQALLRFAEAEVKKNEGELEEGSSDWKEAVLHYLTRPMV